MSERLFRRFVIIGSGQMGVSLALAMKSAGLAGHVELVDRDPLALKRAAGRHAADGYELDLASALAGADAVCLAAPVGAFAGLVEMAAPHLGAGTILTDLGSVKGLMARRCHPTLDPAVALVPSHPLAGSEKSGPDAAAAEIWRGARVVLTPEADAPLAAVERISRLWHELGAETLLMAAPDHDAVLAWTSHLPQVAASALMAAVAGRATQESGPMLELSAGGLRDSTRIAGSSPDLWADILLANRDRLGDAITELLRGLGEFARALETGDRAALHGLLAGAKEGKARLDAAREGRD